MREFLSSFFFRFNETEQEIISSHQTIPSSCVESQTETSRLTLKHFLLHHRDLLLICWVPIKFYVDGVFARACCLFLMFHLDAKIVISCQGVFV